MFESARCAVGSFAASEVIAMMRPPGLALEVRQRSAHEPHERLEHQLDRLLERVGGDVGAAARASGRREFQTRMSRPPNASSVVATARSVSCGSVTSPRTESAPIRSACALELVAPAGEHRHVRALGGERLRAREPEPR